VMDSVITITLKEPLKSRGFFKSNLIEFVKIRRPKIKDLYGLDFSGLNATKSQVILASRLTDLSVEDLEEMNFTDFYTITTAITNLMGTK
jgi:hypothetical protein